MNELLTLIPLFLRSLATAPASASWLTPFVDDLLNLAAGLIESGETGTTELATLTHQIDTMVNANRPPTPDEFAALIARSDAAHAILQKAVTT